MQEMDCLLQFNEGGRGGGGGKGTELPTAPTLPNAVSYWFSPSTSSPFVSYQFSFRINTTVTGMGIL